MLNPIARTTLFALTSCLMLLACNDSAPEPAAQSSAATGKPKPPKAATLETDMVAAVAPDSTLRVIGMHFALTRAPAVNEGLPINIAVVPHQEFSSVAAHFFGQDGLTLVSGDALGPVSDAKPEKPIKHELVMMPTREGVYMISATVDTVGADGTVSRVFSIPVVVQGAAPAATSAPAAPAPK